MLSEYERPYNAASVKERNGDAEDITSLLPDRVSSGDKVAPNGARDRINISPCYRDGPSSGTGRGRTDGPESRQTLLSVRYRST